MNRSCIIFVMAVCLASCAPCRRVPEAIRYKDSTVVNYHDSTIVNIRDSVVFVTLPVESSAAVIPADYASHLETGVAESDVWVDEMKLLHHTIRNKPEKLPVLVPVRDIVRTVASSDSHVGVLIKTVEVPVHAEPSGWLRFRAGAFWWLVALAVVGWRRELFSLVKTIIKLL